MAENKDVGSGLEFHVGPAHPTTPEAAARMLEEKERAGLIRQGRHFDFTRSEKPLDLYTQYHQQPKVDEQPQPDSKGLEFHVGPASPIDKKGKNPLNLYAQYHHQPDDSGGEYNPVTSRRESVTEQRMGNRRIRFHKQLNGYDCGPCMILNVLEIFKNGNGTVKTVEEVRREINKYKSYGEREWVGDIVVGMFLQKNENFEHRSYYASLGANNFQMGANDFQSRVDSNVRDKKEFFAYSGKTGHFSGYFLDKDSRVWLIDSMKDKPVESTVDNLRNYLGDLRRSVYNARVDVVEMTGV